VFDDGDNLGGGGGKTKLLTIIIILLLVCPIASADLDSPSIGAKMVQKGLEFFMSGLADNLYEMGYHPPGHNATNGTTTEIYIYQLNTHTWDPYEHDKINDFRGKCFILLMIAAVIYSTIGGAYVIACIVGAATVIDGVLNRSSSYRTMRIKEYFENLAVAVGVIAFTDIYIMAVLSVNYLICSFIVYGMLTSTTVATVNGNGWLYLTMAILYIMEFWIMIARAILIFMFAASGRLIGVLLISNKTRALGLSIVYYLTGIVFLQSVIVIITSVGYIAIDAIAPWSGIAVEGLMYCVLISIIMLTSLGALVGLVRMKHTAMVAVKMVI
jgi:hypothetical protein